MKFRGLFIGIDRYKSSSISWLNCACNDARALYALFADNVEGESTLLLDQNATRVNIYTEFKKLEKVQEDDIVVVYYSGHGSESHELISYDADCDLLSKTAIPLKELLSKFKKIPSKKLILILDCCFSGGIGSKVLHIENKPKSIESTENILDQLSGEGRIIITASSSNEPAWENSRLGHGFFTYHLIQGFIGAKEVIDSGKIPLYRLLDYVNSKVTASAASIGKEQHPNLRGKIDKAFHFPIFLKGEQYIEEFPEESKAEVTSDLHSLSVYGFPISLINIWSNSIPTLNQLQLESINKYGLFKGNHLIVSAPTSSGKTMIGELAALKGLFERKRAIFLFPLKALVNDKFKYFSSIYGNFGFRTIRATGDTSDEVPLLLRGQYDVCLMTYEKFTALALGNPHVLEQIGTIVVDEVQMIADKNRGANLEFILTLLRIRRKHGIEPQTIALSAVIGDTNGLERWLDGGLLKKLDRPVPLDEGIINYTGTNKYIKSDDQTVNVIQNFVHREIRNGGSQEFIIPLVKKLVSEGKQVILFRETTGEARGAGVYLSNSLGLKPAQSVLDSLPVGDTSIATEALRQALSGGVAIHISHLGQEERLIIEESFRQPNSEIRVISATTTLAMGVNTPAEAVIIAGLEHPGIPPQPYSIAEYKNMIGRAGRLGFANRGASYLIALSPKDEISYWKDYILGTPEDLTSKFLDGSTDPRSLIIKVLTSAKSRKGDITKNVSMTSDDLIDFLEGSFGAYQQKIISGTWKWDRNKLIQALNNLESHNLILRKVDKYQLTELGWITGHCGLEVESVTRLIEALRPLGKEEINDITLLTAIQHTVEADSIYFPLNKRGFRKETISWRSELENQNVSRHVLNQLQTYSKDECSEAARLKKAVACLLWITNNTIGEMETILRRHGGLFDGAAGPIRSASSRTKDMLQATCSIAEFLHKGLDLSKRFNKLFIRLELGIPSSIFDLASFTKNQLTRGDYLSLIRANLISLDTIETTKDRVILKIINKEKLGLIRNAIKHSKEASSEEEFAKIPIYEP